MAESQGKNGSLTRGHYHVKFSNAEDVRRKLASIIRKVEKSSFDVKRANCIMYGCGLLIKLLDSTSQQQITELEGRVEKLAAEVSRLTGKVRSTLG